MEEIGKFIDKDSVEAKYGEKIYQYVREQYKDFIDIFSTAKLGMSVVLHARPIDKLNVDKLFDIIFILTPESDYEETEKVLLDIYESFTIDDLFEAIKKRYSGIIQNFLTEDIDCSPIIIHDDMHLGIRGTNGCFDIMLSKVHDKEYGYGVRIDANDIRCSYCGTIFESETEK